MSFAASALFFAPDREFFPPRKEPIRRLPPPPGGARRDGLAERLTRRLLAMDPIAFMIGLLLSLSLAVVGLWIAMGMILPL